ncbi:3'-5' exoribonuclease [Edwardsiella ictaluri]|uniref:3'-5' exoribonuclease n=1 Tax=Edwardsiella ictaluri TaxID=67780 RepID=A0ABY8GDJ5_EDWIC|nr:3'-5' exonuclease [Edwardsiella ictaluri]ELV7527180.1 3'-5' exoribonuclease [Edwardsiella ictaluri]KMQ79293.1 exodeoxyribonuclease VIII [Edwardsiella ictaluri]KOO55892.1 exodeoxyribonuclease VIII [Edwardsiella ictaluri]WFN95510.1 3'-5' exoribonuclease [Edwardsiella ictaluri]
MTKDVVIDTETMDTVPSALLLSIGAFAVDVSNLEDTQTNILKVSRDIDLQDFSVLAFYTRLDATDQLMLGRTVSIKTQTWWKDQAEDAHEALTGDRVALSEALIGLSRWLDYHPGARVFFRGPDFDGAILENAYRMCGLECPWRYNGKRDVRTYIDTKVPTRGRNGYLEGHQPCFQMIKHHALHDAMNDAEQMAIAYQEAC